MTSFRFQATKNHRFRDMPVSSIRRMVGNRLSVSGTSSHLPTGLRRAPHPADLPEQFDARQKWSFCSNIGRIPDESACSSGWAVTAASVFTDRACIASNGSFDTSLSARDVAECAGQRAG